MTVIPKIFNYESRQYDLAPLSPRGSVYFDKKPVVEGGYKSCFRGVMIDPVQGAAESGQMVETMQKVKEVAIVITRSAGHWNSNELAFLKKTEKCPVPGTVPLILLKEKQVKEGGLSSQFIAVFPWYTTDLYEMFKEMEIIQGRSLRTNRILQEQVITTVAEFHREWIHQDIKPENFLLQITPPKRLEKVSRVSLRVLNDPETQFDIRLCDFGFVQKNSNCDTGNSPLGSPEWMPPEAAHWFVENSEVEKEKRELWIPSEKQDIWGVGLILLALEDFSLFTMIIPSPTDRWNQADRYFVTKCIPDLEHVSQRYPMLLLIKDILQPDPERRPTMEEIHRRFLQIKEEERV